MSAHLPPQSGIYRVNAAAYPGTVLPSFCRAWMSQASSLEVSPLWWLLDDKPASPNFSILSLSHPGRQECWVWQGWGRGLLLK